MSLYPEVVKELERRRQIRGQTNSDKQVQKEIIQKMEQKNKDDTKKAEKYIKDTIFISTILERYIEAFKKAKKDKFPVLLYYNNPKINYFFVVFPDGKFKKIQWDKK